MDSPYQIQYGLLLVATFEPHYLLFVAHSKPLREPDMST